MTRLISEKKLRNIIVQCISESLRYDKEAKRYFPNYTGNPHSDAGKFVDNGQDNFEYSHNDYKWTDAEKQKRFEKLQNQNNFEPNYFDKNRDYQYNAEDYLSQHESDNILDNAAEDLRGDFENLITKFIEHSAKKYPLLKQGYYQSEFIEKLQNILSEYN